MKISTKIILACTTLVALSALAFLATILVQRYRLQGRVDGLIQNQALSEAGKIVETLYLNCEAAERQNQARLSHDLLIAREVIANHGAITIATQAVEWNAVNQLTKQGAKISLPQMLLGVEGLIPNYSPTHPAPVVDEVKHLTRDECTIFQRMNEQGDMLRITTSIIGTNGNRAVGTFIPQKTADGSANPVLEKVLRGETYRGRAFVVDSYYATVYEPIWNPEKNRVIGMIYVGVSMAEINRELHDGITKMVVGKTGYVFVLGAKGGDRGRYIISQQGKRDGESLWETTDAHGRPFIQSIVGKALSTVNGARTNEFYPWKNAKDSQPREKFAVFAYFAPWDWIIAAGAYQDDFGTIKADINNSIAALVRWTIISALLVGAAAFAFSLFLSRSITRPVMEVVRQLQAGADQTAAVAAQVSCSSQSLAGNASEQAASLEEISASLEEVTTMTQRNAQSAEAVKEFANQTRLGVEASVAQTHEMGRAVNGILTASADMRESMNRVRGANGNISKIIKTIDDIAFQTNLLALNAAVEAARAGEAGMGFAVVADEVRTLSQRSAAAAQETAALIEASIKQNEAGMQSTEKVATAVDDVAARSRALEIKLGQILTQTRQMDEHTAQVAAASAEQSQGTSEVCLAVTQMDKVTQGNAASAEECAAASQELNAQAEILKGQVVSLQSLVFGPQRSATAGQNRQRKFDTRHRFEVIQHAVAGQFSTPQQTLKLVSSPSITPISSSKSPDQIGELHCH